MPLTRILLLLGALLAANGSALAATPGEQLKAFLSGLRTLESEFQQTLFDENLKLLEESRGLFFLQRPRRFRWDYRVPQAQLIVADGEKVWIYDRELAQVTVQTMGDTLGATPALLLSSDEPIEKNFEISNLSDQSGLAWVGLKSRVKDPSFVYIRVGFENGELRAMELTDNFGQLTKLEFSNIIRNAPIISDAFEFKPPDGVDVIGEN
jgi:outer membrane lipoprotein carrier protein